MSRLLFSIVVISAAFCCVVSAQNPPATSDQALSAAAQSLTVMGVGTPVADLTLTGTATRIAGLEKEDGTATLKAMLTGEASVDLTFPSGRRTTVYSSSARGPQGVWSGPDEKPHPVSFHNLLVDQGWFSPLLLLERINTQAHGITATYSGSVERNGRSLTVLHVAAPVPGENAGKHPAWMLTLLQRASQFDLYLDATTFLPSEMTFNGHPDNNLRQDLPVRVRYSGYRSVEGIQVPFHIQEYVNNSLILDVHVDTATFNTGLTASSFSVQ